MNWRIRRHDLIFVSPRSWRAALTTRRDLASDPLVAPWAAKGWPLVARRQLPVETSGVALGLPLPPFAGKHRLSFHMQPEDILSTCRPPALHAVRQAAPRVWWPTLDRLNSLASPHSMEVRVFGSLAWQALTGLSYLTDRSDLDILFHVQRNTDLQNLTAGLARIEAGAPMRLDGELVREDGAAVNWREFHGAPQQILIKTAGSVALLDRSHFLVGEVRA